MLSSTSKHWVLKQLFLKNVLDHLDKTLFLSNCQWMPIKGAYLIMSGLSEKITSRDMSDVDILVRPENFYTVMQIFRQDFRLDGSAVFDHSAENVFNEFNGVQILLEIHHRLKPDYVFRLPVSELIGRGIPVTQSMILPCLEDALLIAVLHQLKGHLTHLPSTTLYGDIGAISEAPGFDWTKFWSFARETGVYRSVNMLLAMYNKDCGKNIPIRQRSPHIYFIEAAIRRKWFYRLPLLCRKLLVAIFFWRNPWAWMWFSVVHRLGRREKRVRGN